MQLCNNHILLSITCIPVTVPQLVSSLIIYETNLYKEKDFPHSTFTSNHYVNPYLILQQNLLHWSWPHTPKHVRLTKIKLLIILIIGFFFFSTPINFPEQENCVGGLKIHLMLFFPMLLMRLKLPQKRIKFSTRLIFCCAFFPKVQ